MRVSKNQVGRGRGDFTRLILEAAIGRLFPRHWTNWGSFSRDPEFGGHFAEILEMVTLDSSPVFSYPSSP